MALQPQAEQYGEVCTFVTRDDPSDAAERCIAMLTESLMDDPLAGYFTRRNPASVRAFWQEKLRSAVRSYPDAQQIYCLKDFSAAAMVLQMPAHAASPWVALLRLMPIVPLSRWRALTEYLQSLNAQKQAFGRTHGPFLYLMALGAPPEAAVSGPDDPRVRLLQHLLEVADKEQQMVYIEARPAHRAWYRPYGFREIMAYQPRKSAPSIHIMARSPVPARAQPVSPEVRSPRR